MAATAGLSLTLDPMGKMFQNASSLKPLGQLNPNCPGMIIGRSSTKFLFFYADRKFKMATTAIHRLTLDPTLWNSLPLSLRNVTSLDVFKRELKTHFFRIAFKNFL